jgi:precorrin-6B methylase 2
MRTAVFIDRLIHPLLAGLLLAAPNVAMPSLAQEAAVASRTPDVHYVPTAPEIVERMLELTRVTEDDLVYDLGCGDGRIVIAAVRRYGARGVCVDIDPERIRESRHNADSLGVADRIEFIEGDLFETDLRPATVVTLYLLPALNLRLRPKLFEELRPGTRVVSHQFDMGDWVGDSVEVVKRVDGGESLVHTWVIPADVAGRWTVTVQGAGGDRRYTLQLEQTYQQFNGTAGAVAPGALADTHLVGDSIWFTLTDEWDGRPAALHFSGHVKDDEMGGNVTTEEGSPLGTWSATRGN